jgi:hypothetical protein
LQQVVSIWPAGNRKNIIGYVNYSKTVVAKINLTQNCNT